MVWKQYVLNLMFTPDGIDFSIGMHQYWWVYAIITLIICETIYYFIIKSITHNSDWDTVIGAKILALIFAILIPGIIFTIIDGIINIFTNVKAVSGILSIIVVLILFVLLNKKIAEKIHGDTE